MAAAECTLIRLLIVDDHKVVRQGLRFLLQHESDIEIVGEAADGEQAVAAVRQHVPTVVLLDLLMPKMDGLDFIRRLGHKGVHAPIVVCSGTLTDGERPTIPGVQLTPKTPDLRALWTALRSAVPAVSELTVAAKDDSVIKAVVVPSAEPHTDGGRGA